MDGLDAIRREVATQSHQMSVWRQQSKTTYGSDDRTNVGTAYVSVSEPSSSSTVEAEGTDSTITLVGYVDPSYAPYGEANRVDVQVTDELRLTANEAQRYVVETRDGLPNDLDAEVIRLGLRKANQSQ
jgi:hypothetical protein